MKVKINTVVGNDYSVTFELDDGTKIDQKIAVVPFDSKDGLVDPKINLEDFFRNYIEAYLAGKEVEAAKKTEETESKKLEGTTLTL